MEVLPRITDVEIRNVLKVKYVHLNPGVMTIIGGDNEQGKSSVLDALAMALGGPRLCPKDVPIRKGEKVAEVKIELSESDVLPACTIHRKWNLKKDGSTQSTLQIISKDPDSFERDEESPDGNAKSAAPQTTINQLVSTISFDPLEFLRKKPKEQAEQLQTMLGLDFTDTNRQIQRLFDERTGLNRDLTRAEGTLKSLPSYPDAPAELIDPSSIADEFEEIRKYNEGVESKLRLAKLAADEHAVAVIKAESAKRNTQKWKDEVLRLTDELARAKAAFKEAGKAEIEAMEADEVARINAKDIAEKTEALSLKTTDHLKDRSKEIEETNSKVRSNQAKAAQRNAVRELTEKAEKLTEKIDELRQSKLTAVSQAEWPIEGMGFDEDGYLTYDGLPFDQACTSSKVRACIAIGVAMNPKLKFMIVREGSLFDDNRLVEMAQYAAEHGCQVFMERVSKGDECHVVMQDGEDIKALASV